ncbi:YqkE family protein [Lederbergia citrea]|uniref:YqkE family protein n=1 Tax=Lederbergia citrea TaxID=2833581 RepID=A0A942UN29_9BACI|nr:YqkE family protein [Lederbergia citrea]MBS4176435.1 YqkE family protein [Lederbergia citrea]MBS4202996.1 YqkE family protein [Lederbergia citrea]MBS4222332.1 YqkE family protein [Lederbergia citrea]
MAKQRKRQQKLKEQDTGNVTLKDGLNPEVLQKLKQTQYDLLEAEEQKKTAEKAKKLEEKKQRDKNKTFEELLNETPLNWKDYK